MKLEATIIAYDDALEQVFSAETEINNDRASWELRKVGDQTQFHITATDSTALRAVLNSITRSLTVIEKMREIR
ncbi:hypothetical protein H6504_01100 [Candidatus Woesearchaeota archaeon]|nr:hypothetical protein [Candidatus Woesearchaeota archaeon]